IPFSILRVLGFLGVLGSLGALGVLGGSPDPIHPRCPHLSAPCPGSERLLSAPELRSAHRPNSLLTQSPAPNDLHHTWDRMVNRPPAPQPRQVRSRLLRRVSRSDHHSDHHHRPVPAPRPRRARAFPAAPSGPGGTSSATRRGSGSHAWPPRRSES